MRVLVADANRDVRSALGIALRESLGPVTLDEVGTAAELMPKFAQTQPDVLIVDWGLLASGQTENAMAGLRASGHHVAMIVLSGNPDSRPHAVESGADHFVAKSDPPERLLDILRDIKARQQTSPS